MRRTAQLEIAREAQRRDHRSRAQALEFVDVAGDETSATRTLEGGIGGHLHAGRSPRNRRPERTPPEHSGRVHDVRLARPVMDERRPADVS